jgi:hypothetical protein
MADRPLPHFWLRIAVSAVCFLVPFVLWGVCELKGVDVVQIEKGNGVFSIPSIELSPYGYRRKVGFNPDAFHMPLCFLAGIFTALTVVPWLPWWSTRFSLRSLLVTMTMIAVLLGMGAWLLPHLWEVWFRR